MFTLADAGVAPTGVPAPPAADTTSAYLQQQQQELQNKILNILNGSGSTGAGAVSQPAQSVAAGYRGPVSAGIGRGQSSTSQAPSPMINFDNPNVKKALDSLIQSGPNLLKSLPSRVDAAAPSRPQFAAAQTMEEVPRQQAGYPGQAQLQTTQSAAGQFGGYGGQFQQQSPPQGQAPARAPAPGYGAVQQRPTLGARLPQAQRPRY